MSDRPNKLIEQSQALDSFFESLMRDVEAYEENESQQQTSSLDENKQQNDNTHNMLKTVQPESIVEDKRNDLKDSESETALPIIPETKQEPAKVVPVKPLAEQQKEDNIFETLPPVAPAPVITPQLEIPQEIVESTETPEITPQVETIHELEQETEQTPLGKPEWAESEFQAMIFKVAGLTLAVPLIELNGIVECDLSTVTAMPGHADFYLGLMNHLDKTVPLVDTARFVLPPDKLKILASDNPEERITRVVMIQDCQYGLACDEVGEVITLSPESVRWRTQRTQRRWLAGTVIEHMCALIDANAFAELLASRAPIQDFRE